MRLRSCDYRPEELAFLEIGYKIMTAAELTKAFNLAYGKSKSEGAIKQTCQRHGFEAGRSGYFPKGSTPWNKGKKGVNGFSATTFKKGHLPATTKPLYTERVSKDGFIEVKVQLRGDIPGKTTFRHKHVWVWEQLHGPVPRGSVIRFKDGDNRNFSPDNLICITRHLHLLLNRRKFNAVPMQFKDTALLTARMEEQIYKRLAA